MKKVWVVVANSTVSKIFQADGPNKLTLHKLMEHEEGHLKARDIMSDSQGRNNQRGVYGSDTYQERTPLKLKEADQFAHQICQYLEENYKTKAFEHLYLVAKPPFLSHLRNGLSDNVAKVVKSEIHKDLILMTPEEIREYLPPVL